jgi:glutamate racemase
MNKLSPIGVFDSGYGGLTILKEIKNLLPQHDFIYLGDNARTPYGTRSFKTVYDFTKECVKWLFERNCPLVILACNTASAKALRTIQQKDLPEINTEKRVLGVIRPTAEVIGNFSISNQIGILGTNGTVQSGSYLLEIEKSFPGIKIFQQACPLWVPLIENNEYESEGADFFIKKDIQMLLEKSPEIDTILLACTHYPLVLNKIKTHLRGNIKVISQGAIVAKSLQDYLKRHPEMERRCSKNGQLAFFTTDSAVDFDKHSEIFFGGKVSSVHIDLV